MVRNRKLLLVKFSLVAIAVPLVIRAHSAGPDPFLTGNPKDGGASCTQCHVGTALNGGGGKVQIILPGSATWSPGVPQQIKVTVSDPSARAWGFQLTARTSADNSQAGDLSSIDSNTWVICADGQPAPCAAGANTQFVEHTHPQFSSGSGTFTFQWTPPASASGNVVLYAAGNAANGNGSSTGDHIYTTSVQLTPAAAAGPPPTIDPGGVVPIFTTSTSISPGSWISIYGKNLASANAIWNGEFPTSLGGVSVTINGKPAYIWFVSSGQVNVEVPDDTARGSVNVVVTNPNGSATSTVTLAPVSPTFSLFDQTHPAGVILTSNGSGFYLADGSAAPAGKGVYDLLGPAGLFGFNTRAVKKGEVVELFGTGFGPTNPAVPAGKAFSGAAPTTLPITVSIGGISQSVTAYVVQSGMYQINVPIPSNVGSGEQLLQATVNGVQTPATVRIAVQ